MAAILRDAARGHLGNSSEARGKRREVAFHDTTVGWKWLRVAKTAGDCRTPRHCASTLQCQVEEQRVVVAQLLQRGRIGGVQQARADQGRQAHRGRDGGQRVV